MSSKEAIAEIWQLLEAVTDPEIPVLTVRDMGIVRDVRQSPDGITEVVITPTYSGCPAMHTIEINIKAVLQEHGFENVKVTSVLHPAWTTAWLTTQGREKLLAYGIAPPVEETVDKTALFGGEKNISCPLCSSTHTQMISQFGSTACKALYRCLDCLEPFDYFKCH